MSHTWNKWSQFKIVVVNIITRLGLAPNQKNPGNGPGSGSHSGTSQQQQHFETIVDPSYRMVLAAKPSHMWHILTVPVVPDKPRPGCTGLGGHAVSADPTYSTRASRLPHLLQPLPPLLVFPHHVVPALHLVTVNHWCFLTGQAGPWSSPYIRCFSCVLLILSVCEMDLFPPSCLFGAHLCVRLNILSIAACFGHQVVSWSIFWSHWQDLRTPEGLCSHPKVTAHYLFKVKFSIFSYFLLLRKVLTGLLSVHLLGAL